MREVFACVEVFEEAGCGFQIIVEEIDALFGGVAVRGDGVEEEGRLEEEGLMRAEGRRCVAGADLEGYDGRFEVALRNVGMGAPRLLRVSRTYSTNVTRALGFSVSIAVSSSTSSPGASAAPVSPTSTSSSLCCISTSLPSSAAPAEIRTSGSAITEWSFNCAWIFPN